MNLATNAWHAIEPATGTVRLSIEPSVLDGRPYARVRVEDDGRGMDDAVLERIFEPFFTTKGVGRGAGLGLSVVHGIVTDHGGRVVVTSAPGQGSVFDVYLPVTSESGHGPGRSGVDGSGHPNDALTR
jgi:signal transduction histidine kinase